MSKINVRGGKDLISYGFLYWRNYKIMIYITKIMIVIQWNMQMM